MSERRWSTTVGLGAAACAGCCAGPVLGALAALGVGAALALMASVAVGVIAVVLAGVASWRRRQRSRCVDMTTPVPVELTPRVGR